MTSISSLQSIVNGTSSTASTTDSVKEAEDRFMKILIAQMRNQDPLNPLDNAEITSQLAQLSTVTGINKLQVSLENLQASFQTSQSLQAADMIGRGVFVTGSSIALYSATDTSGTTTSQGVLAANLSGAADSVVLTIRDSSGVAVYTENLGAKSAGMMTYSWDGKTSGGDTAKAGIYSFEVAATSAGEAVKATTLSFGEVLSVSTGASGIELNVENIGAVSTADVVQIY
ncbi:MAG: flagellar biosynthesis protein FlgD [Oxalobacter sp.]|nr:MAG: flagellar biosynthesis protein FlgD [Oxalobacter sp.]